jgi:hypoxanthine phosphoribosyltransferase
VDDACGTGTTLSAIVEKLKEKEPKRIKSLAVILFLKNGKPVCPIQPDYTLFKLEDRYIVGYGIDHKQRYRNLPGIYELKNYD